MQLKLIAAEELGQARGVYRFRIVVHSGEQARGDYVVRNRADLRRDIGDEFVFVHGNLLPEQDG